MKKAIHIISFAAVALTLLSSCAKEQFKENAIPAGEKVEVSLSGQIVDFTPADATKATAESVVRVTWGSGDKVYVYDGSNASIGTLTVAPDNKNASYAMLSGTITASAASPAPSKLTLVYVKGATEAPAISGGKVSVDLSNQNQAEVPFVLYTTVDYNAATLTKTNEYISFTFATSVMTVNCTGLQTNAGSKIDVTKAEIDGVSTACELTIDGSGVTAVAGTTPGKITRTGTSVFQQSDSRGSFRLALAADPTTPAARNILVHQGSKVSGSPFTSATLAGGKSYNTVYQMGEYISNAPNGMLSGEFTVSDPDGIPNSGDETKVHFSKGNLYADGDKALHFEDAQWKTTPASNGSKDASHVSHLTWSSTVEAAVGDSNSGDYLFCDENNKVSVDGGEAMYYVLSKDEWTYLFNNHSKKWASVNGVNGYVIAPDDFSGELSATYADDAALAANNLVFLPAAGSRRNSDVNNFGVYGNYWSSSPNGSSRAYSVSFLSGSVRTNNGVGRYYGYSVRLVTESSGGYSPAVKVTGVTISKEETSITVGKKDTLVATIAPANATNKQITWSSSKPSVATVNENGEVTGVAAGSANIFATTADGNFDAVCLVTVKLLPPTTGTAKRTGNIDVNWVQLWAGGPKFAEYNVGVTDGKAESYGGYYCWGKSVDKDPNGDYNDGTVVLSGDDDTATNLWGGNWRMPTQTELQGLIDNCTVEWTQVNSVNGRKFTGKGAYASNSVFLPAAGFCYYGDANRQGSLGVYRSSTPDGDLNFGSGSQYLDSGFRNYGYSVRAVLAE